MTRKDYQLIAKALKDAGYALEHQEGSKANLETFVDTMAIALKEDTSKFDIHRFRAACYD